MDYGILLKFFIGLVAIINPIGVLPVFSALTSNNTSKERLHINLVANISVALILAVSFWCGSYILNWFSISIDSFRIAGGVMILSFSFAMVRGHLESGRHNQDEKEETEQKDSISIVPLAIPLMAGPGAISTTIVFSGQYSANMVHSFGALLVIVLFSIFSFLVFLSTNLTIKILGNTGINIVTRIMGIIMMSIGIEMISKGVKSLFYVDKFLELLGK